MIKIKNKQFFNCEQLAIEHILGNSTSSCNLTSNSITSLKYLYFRKHYILTKTDKCFEEYDNTVNMKNKELDSIYEVTYEKNNLKETFEDFIKSLQQNQYHYYDEVDGEIKSYVDIDFFNVNDYGPGDIINVKTKNGIRRFIINMKRDNYDDITDSDSIPYKYCQIYGYQRYLDTDLQLELDEIELQFLYQNDIIVYSNLDETTYGTLKKVKNSYFIFNKHEKWQRITIIPNSYGREVGFKYYENIIKDNNWDIQILVSPLEYMNLQTLEIIKMA